MLWFQLVAIIFNIFISWLRHRIIISHLKNDLQSCSETTKIEAIHKLCDIGTAQTSELIIPALKDASASVRAASAKAIGIIRYTNAITPLISTLNDIDTNVRGASVTALGEIGNEKAASILIDILKDQNKHLRVKAAHALRKIGHPIAVAP